MKTSDIYPSISVIIPVYNVEKYVSKCISSILNQTYKNFQLILVDDGSTDTSGTICDEFACVDDRIEVIHKENGGLSDARNKGIDWCIDKGIGEWITFIDSDDFVHPQFLEKMMEAAVSTNSDVAVCGMTSDFEQWNVIQKNFDGKKIYNNKEACLFIYTNEKQHATYVSACAKLFKTSLLKNIRFPYGKLYEDQFTTYKIIYKATKIVEIGDKLYGYYMRDSSIMHSPFSLRCYENLEACTQAELFFTEHGEFKIAEEAEKKKKMITARYAISARKYKMYNMVPKKYRMMFFKAVYIIYNTCGNDYCEFFLAQYYPRFIKLYSYVKKVLCVKDRGRKVNE